MKASMMVATVNIIIGNGTGHHEIIKNKAYSLATLKSDMRLSLGQIRAYFREGYHKKVVNS